MKFIIDELGNLKKVKSMTRFNHKIIVPDNVTCIDNSCFFGCKNIHEIVLPSTIRSISDCAFQNCTNLEKINLPKEVKTIGEYAFENCKKLESISLPESLKTIENYAFNNCENLTEIIIPNSVTEIKYKAFAECKNLKKVSIPNSVKKIDWMAFYDSRNIESFFLESKFTLNKIGLSNIISRLKHVYYNRNKESLLFLKDENPDLEQDKITGYQSIKELLGCDTNTAIILSLYFNPSDIEKMKSLKKLLQIIVKENFNETTPKILEDLKNYKEYELMINFIYNEKKYSYINVYQIFKLAYSLGAFENSKEQRQRATEFIKNCFEKEMLNPKKVHKIFMDMKLKKYNEEWSTFFMNKNNFYELINLEHQRSGNLSRAYNEFQDIKEYGRSNRGDQRYRKVTIDMCKEYLDTAKFKGITPFNIDIANIIAKYTRKQRTFDSAAQIRKDFISLKSQGLIKDHIVDEPIKEDIFSSIDEERKFIIHSASSTLNNINQKINDSFTYEFLSKYDPENYFLGKYCTCCSHLEGEGLGIVKATILHPDCQNIIIKDKNGNIISKSTLYVNRKQGYGVLNNIEIRDSISSKEDKEIIYIKYLKALEQFTSIYNKKNPTRPITQINVGMNRNDLDNVIRHNSIKSRQKLKGLNFSLYDDFGHEGDWMYGQYIMWSKNNKHIKKVK